MSNFSDRDSEDAGGLTTGHTNMFAHELSISANGDWIDNVYKSNKPSSLGTWIRGRRAWSPSADRAIFTGADILERGYLEKQGSWRKNWKSRYFILRSDTHSLCYFNNHVDMLLLGEVVISTNSEVWRGALPPKSTSTLTATSTKLFDKFNGKSTKSLDSNTGDNSPGVLSPTAAALQHSPGIPPPPLSEASPSSSLVFGVKCSTTGHILTMSAPDPLSLTSWLQSIQEEISAARTAGLNRSCTSLTKSSPATAHSGTVQELLETFAGVEVRPVVCTQGTAGPAPTPSRRTTSADDPTVKKKQKPGMFSRFTSFHEKRKPASASCIDEVGTTGTPPKPITAMLRSSPVADKKMLGAVVEQPEDNAAEPLPPPPPHSESSDDEDRVEHQAEVRIAESFSPTSATTTKITITEHSADIAADHNHVPAHPESSSSTRSRTRATAQPAVGLHLSVQLSGVCDASDGLFVVVFGGRVNDKQMHELEAQREKDEGPFEVDVSNVEWIMMGRTEVVEKRDAGSIIARTQESHASHDGTNSNSHSSLPQGTGVHGALVCRQFSCMINDPSRYNVDLLMFAVYKPIGHSDDLTTHHELAWGVLDATNLLPDEYMRLPLNTVIKPNSMSGFQEMNADLNLRLPSEVFMQPEPIAYIGVCATHSVPLTRRAYIGSQRLGYKSYPYVHKLYGFQSLTGQVLTREELHLPKYSLSVPAALLGLLLEERLPSMTKLCGVVDIELAEAVKTLKRLQKEASGGGGSGEIDGEPIDIMDEQIMYYGKLAGEIEAAENRVSTLTRGRSVLEEVNGRLTEEYLGCYNYCVEGLKAEETAGMAKVGGESGELLEAAEEVKGMGKGRKKDKKGASWGVMGVPVHMGGGRLKRSVTKKSKELAFIPTNLNIQLMHTESVRNRLYSKTSGEEEKEGEGAEGKEEVEAAPKALDTFATATFGVPSAHSLGTKQGGLRRLLLSSGTDGVFSNDNVASGARAAQKKKLQQTKEDPLRISSVENDLSTSRAAQVCALHARGLEMTVADLQTHASGRRRNSILRVAAMSSSFVGGSVDLPRKEEEQEGGEEKKSRLTGEVEDWIKCSELMHRVDIVTSQMLSISIAMMQNSLAMAASGSPHHINILPRVLEAGFLVSVESLLSAYGGELCMLEDLAVAVEWLSTVTVRIVENVKDKKGKGMRSSSQLNQEGHDYMDTSEENRRGFGYSEGVWIRRGTRNKDVRFSSSRDSVGSEEEWRREDIAGIKWGELIVDIEVNSAVAQCIREAKVVSEACKKGKKEHIFTKLTRRTSSPLMDNKTQARGAEMGVAEGAGKSGSPGGIEGAGVKRMTPSPLRFAGAHELGEKMKKALHLKKKKGEEKVGEEEEGEEGEGEESAEEEKEKEQMDTEWGSSSDRQIVVLSAVKLTGVLFTQGINAQQTLVNVRAGGDNGIQTSINRASMQRLKGYAAKFKSAMVMQGKGKGPGRKSVGPGHVPLSTQASEVSGKTDAGSVVMEGVREESEVLDTLLGKAQAVVNDSCVFSNEKNVNVLLRTADLCRAMNGCHGVMCKSGKDRSSMAVTLEQARYLCSNHGVVGGKKSCEIMRRHGVRRYNVWANTGQKNFAFNGINYTSLPKCFKPPPGCYSGSVVT